MYQNIATKVLTGEVRLSYCNLTTPRASKPGAEEKYSVTLLIPKADTATKADIDRSIQAAIDQGVTKKWNGARPNQPKIPVHDGDGLKQNGEPYGEECKGHWVLTASSKDKPQVVDTNNHTRELPPTEIYSGMYGRVTINFFPYDNSGNRGVGCGLGNVLKTRDGEAFSGRTSAANDFEGLELAQPYTQQPYTQQPYTQPVYPQSAQQPYTQPVYPQNPTTGIAYDPVTGLPE